MTGETWAYSMDPPPQFRTRQQARYYYAALKPKSIPEAGTLKQSMLFETLNKIKAVQVEEKKKDIVQRWTAQITETKDGSPMWVREYQAGVWFWQNTKTGETTTEVPPGQLNTKSFIARRVLDVQHQHKFDHVGTGALAYEPETYTAFNDFLESNWPSPPRGDPLERGERGSFDFSRASRDSQPYEEDNNINNSNSNNSNSNNNNININNANNINNINKNKNRPLSRTKITDALDNLKKSVATSAWSAQKKNGQASGRLPSVAASARSLHGQALAQPSARLSDAPSWDRTSFPTLPRSTSRRSSSQSHHDATPTSSTRTPNQEHHR